MATRAFIDDLRPRGVYLKIPWTDWDEIQDEARRLRRKAPELGAEIIVRHAARLRRQRRREEVAA